MGGQDLGGFLWGVSMGGSLLGGVPMGGGVPLGGGVLFLGGAVTFGGGGG